MHHILHICVFFYSFLYELNIYLLFFLGFFFFVCREVYAVSLVGPFPTAVTNLLDLTRLYDLYIVLHLTRSLTCLT